MKRLINYQTNHSYINNFLSKNVAQTNVSIIKEMMYLAQNEIKKGKNIISLSVGIPYYPMPKYIKEEVAKRLIKKPDVDKYTFFVGLPELRQIIAKKITNELGVKTDEENILITPGSMAALKYAIEALVDEGDEVIVFSPYFSSYGEQIKLSGGKVVEVPLKIVENEYHLDLEKTEKAISKKTKAIIVNSPSNPTGAVFSKNELLELAKIIKKKDIYLITDEVYDYLIYDNTFYFNIASVSYLWPKVIRCWSFSKKYGMTGWRLGYLHTNKELLKHILKIHDSTIVCASHLAQEAGIVALSKENDKEIEENINQLKRNRKLLMSKLDEMKDLFSYIPPKGAYYMFVKYNLPISSVEMAKKILYEAQVAVVPGSGFGKNGEGYLRISFGGYEKDILEATERIKNWYKKST